jgi:hypothetical protein
MIVSEGHFTVLCVAMGGVLLARLHPFARTASGITVKELDDACAKCVEESRLRNEKETSCRC